MEQKKNGGYGTSYCAMAVVCAACRSLVHKKTVSVVEPFKNGPRMMVLCTRDEENLFQYAKRNADGVLIRATATLSDETGVDLSFGEGMGVEKGIPIIPQATLSGLLAVIAAEAGRKAVRVVLSADAEFVSFDEIPDVWRKENAKTIALLLGKPKEETVSALKAQYGEEGVKTADGFLKGILELAKTSVVNLLFAGSLKDVAQFFGIRQSEASRIFGYFKNGSEGFMMVSSPLAFKEIRNQQTLTLLQTLSDKQIKTGILITQK